MKTDINRLAGDGRRTAKLMIIIAHPELVQVSLKLRNVIVIIEVGHSGQEMSRHVVSTSMQRHATVYKRHLPAGMSVQNNNSYFLTFRFLNSIIFKSFNEAGG